MGKVKVLISNKQSAVKIPSGIRLLIRRCCHAVLRFENFDDDAEISISFVDNKEIKSLNAQYRNKDTATDVLSFPLSNDGEFDRTDSGSAILGDIVISIEKAMQQAEMFGHSFQREMAYLTVHSALHLLGNNHENGGIDAVRMREKEETILKSMGLVRQSSYVMSDYENSK